MSELLLWLLCTNGGTPLVQSCANRHNFQPTAARKSSPLTQCCIRCKIEFFNALLLRIVRYERQHKSQSLNWGERLMNGIPSFERIKAQRTRWGDNWVVSKFILATLITIFIAVYDTAITKLNATSLRLMKENVEDTTKWRTWGLYVRDVSTTRRMKFGSKVFWLPKFYQKTYRSPLCTGRFLFSHRKNWNTWISNYRRDQRDNFYVPITCESDGAWSNTVSWLLLVCQNWNCFLSHQRTLNFENGLFKKSDRLSLSFALCAFYSFKLK